MSEVLGIIGRPLPHYLPGGLKKLIRWRVFAEVSRWLSVHRAENATDILVTIDRDIGPWVVRIIKANCLCNLSYTIVAPENCCSLTAKERYYVNKAPKTTSPTRLDTKCHEQLTWELIKSFSFSIENKHPSLQDIEHTVWLAHRNRWVLEQCDHVLVAIWGHRDLSYWPWQAALSMLEEKEPQNIELCYLVTKEMLRPFPRVLTHAKKLVVDEKCLAPTYLPISKP